MITWISCFPEDFSSPETLHYLDLMVKEINNIDGLHISRADLTPQLTMKQSIITSPSMVDPNYKVNLRHIQAKVIAEQLCLGGTYI